MGWAGYERGLTETGKADNSPVPEEGWSRTVRDAWRAQYHYYLPGEDRPICGRKISSMRNLPRQLTERQIESQACNKCATMRREAADGQ